MDAKRNYCGNCGSYYPLTDQMCSPCIEARKELLEMITPKPAPGPWERGMGEGLAEYGFAPESPKAA